MDDENKSVSFYGRLNPETGLVGIFSDNGIPGQIDDDVFLGIGKVGGDSREERIKNWNELAKPNRILDIAELEDWKSINLPMNEVLDESLNPNDDINFSQKSRANIEKPGVEEDKESKFFLPDYEISQDERGNSSQPQMEESKKESAGGKFLDDVEQWTQSLFEPAKRGIADLKSELEQDVDESNWIRKAAGASLLDTLDVAMSFTEGIPLGILDTRRLGEGVSKGTLEGALEDATRALNLLPQGRFLRVADRAVTGAHVGKSIYQGVKSLTEGDVKTAATSTMTGGFGVAASIAGRKAKIRGNSKSTKHSKKIGAKPEDIIYSDSIASDKHLKKSKKGKGTGMDSNHLLLAEWFYKGPKHIKGLEDYVPSVLLLGGSEHQSTFHGEFNKLMRKEGLFQKSKYSQAEIERAMSIVEKIYKNGLGGELGKSWADACKDFRLNVFDQVKK